MTRRPAGPIIAHALGALLLTVSGLAFVRVAPAEAAGPPPPPGPDRVVPISVDYTAYTWWMATWAQDRVDCSLTVDHEGLPTLGDVYTNCDPNVYSTYKSQPPCDVGALAGGTRRAECQGYYLYMVSTSVKQRVVTVTLPPPQVWLSLEGCDSVSRVGTNICETQPVLVLTGEEPLPNQHILRIEGTVDNQPFTCDAVCKLQLAPTSDNGAALQFWAWSSYGDSSEVFKAQVRVAQTSDGNPDQPSYYIDVLSSQWRGVRVASCSDVWDSFPPVGGPPAWLTTPRDPSELNSDIPYSYLSANLILQGAVDASGCPDGGLLPNDAGANQCGQEASRTAVDEWQNQFDTLILSTSNDTGVPAQLLKNLFARESQFWPGVFRASADAGLGQLTENGADTTLLWNPSFYAGYCPLVLSSDTCADGYLHLKPDQQALLRQALVGSVNATCDNCALGIDLSRANFSVGVFARTLMASCEQTAQVVYNLVKQSPGAVATYEDLWKFTLVNYNAGPGCLSLAADAAWSSDRQLTWDTVSSHFTDVCLPAKAYVDDISK